MSVRPKIVELGVLDGVNARQLVKTLQPQYSLFVDSWSSRELLDNYSVFDPLPSWTKPANFYEKYFKGPLDKQSTFDSLHQSAIENLNGIDNCQIKKANTFDEFKIQSKIGSVFDYIYLDANHQYEYVLRELLEWSQLSNSNTLIQLNDCVYSEKGSWQNLGVLSALREFLMRSIEWRVISQTTGNFADVLLCKKNSAIEKNIYSIMFKSNINFVELPDHLVFTSKCNMGRMCYV